MSSEQKDYILETIVPATDGVVATCLGLCQGHCSASNVTRQSRRFPLHLLPQSYVPEVHDWMRAAGRFQIGGPGFTDSAGQ